MANSNSVSVDQGAIGEFAVGEFVQGDPFSAWRVGSVFSEPVRLKIAPALAIALIASGPVQVLLPEQGSLTGSYAYAWSEPVRERPGTHASRQQFLAYAEAGTQNAPFGRGEVNFAEETTYSRYAYPWSEPVRLPVGLKPYLQQTFTADTEPVPTSKGMGWYAVLSEPVREKIGLGAQLQQVFTGDTESIPTSKGVGWYANLADPVKLKPGLGTWLQQFYTNDAEVVPGSGELLQGWLQEFGKPIWPLKGLKFYLQQFLAYHPRILPTPTITMVMDATEINSDVALFAINVYDAASTSTSGQGARVSIVEVSAGGNDPYSVRES